MLSTQLGKIGKTQPKFNFFCINTTRTLSLIICKLKKNGKGGEKYFAPNKSWKILHTQYFFRKLFRTLFVINVENVSYPQISISKMFRAPVLYAAKCFVPRSKFIRRGMRVKKWTPPYVCDKVIRHITFLITSKFKCSIQKDKGYFNACIIMIIQKDIYTIVCLLPSGRHWVFQITI